MTKSDYVRRGNENHLLMNGYICISEKDGMQTWVDIQKQGLDIEHWVCMYETYVDRLSLYSPREAQKAGAVYFVVGGPDNTKMLQTTIIENAIRYSRIDPNAQSR